MTQVYLGIGSNTDRERNIASCLNELRRRFGELKISPVYCSQAVGFEGADFYNLAVGFDTGLGPEALNRQLHEIEAEHGRTREGPRFSDRTLDIDLLLHGERTMHTDALTLPRPEILEYAFVIKPLADIAPDLVHPTEKRTIGDIWRDFPESEVKLVPVSLTG